MVKKFLKSKSKRLPAKKRYKIEKKVREHNRKIKKLEKIKERSKNKKNKMIIVPGNCPFKEKILAEASSLRESISLKKLAKREQIKANRKAKRAEVVNAKRGLSNGAAPKVANSEKSSTTAPTTPAATFEDLLKRAQDRGYHFEKIEQQKTQRDPSLKAFYREFQQVIGDSDVIIEVLDSRDPLGTRSTDAEEAVRSHSDKKLMMVMNKCDLIPVENLQKWIAYLKQTESCVVLPFKANTQKQKDRLGSIGNVNTQTQSLDSKKSIGVNDLMGLLGTWARGSAGGITIGVIGMPNVGKSSLINSLKRSRACNVGAMPGITRACQIVSLDSKLKLIDSPGVVFSKEKGEESMTVDTILTRVPKATLMLQYGIGDFKDSEEFLCNIAMKFGQMKKGGVPNPTAAEQKIIHDWHTGAIRFFTEPPELKSTTSSAAIVSDLSAPFSLDNFVPNLEPDADMNGSSDENVDEDNEEDVEMSEEETEVPQRRVTRSAAQKSVTFAVDTELLGHSRSKKKLKAAAKDSPKKSCFPNVGKVSVIATKKAFMKKIKKAKKKSAKHASDLSDMVDTLSFKM